MEPHHQKTPAGQLASGGLARTLLFGMLCFCLAVVLTRWIDASAPRNHLVRELEGVEPAGAPWPRRSACEAYLGAKVDRSFSVVLTADPGDFSGTSEAHYIIENLVNKKSKPRDSTVCGSHFSGLLMGQPVLVVTTGIGPPAAGLCTLEVVTACGQHIDEIIYFGTSGWSPQLGGVLDPPNCSSANTNGRIARMGDVCISPFSVNWTCKKSSWTQQAGGYPNQCFRPPEASSPNATILYGECQFYKDNMAANLDLADELLVVSASKQARSNMPRRSPAVTTIEQRYWSAMGNATGVDYPVPPPTAGPTYFDYQECMEVDGQFFYSGVPFEVKARDYAAEVLTAAFGKAYTSADVIAISAMEGIGVAEALLKYHALSTTKRYIPYTHVRTLSNWLHQTVHQVSPGNWALGEELPEDFVTGYSYAIATGSATLMSLYQRRCQTDVQAGRLPAQVPPGSPFAMPMPLAPDVMSKASKSEDICTFVIDYGNEVVPGRAKAQQAAQAQAAGEQQDQPQAGALSSRQALQHMLQLRRPAAQAQQQRRRAQGCAAGAKA